MNGSNNRSMISLKEITKIYRTDEVETTALRNIELEIKSGEFVAVTGPSGCGKSTLLHILGLLDSPSSGSYFLNDEEVSGIRESQRTTLRKGHIGFVFQNFNLIDELTVFENVELPLMALKVKRSRRKEEVNEVLRRLKIGHRSRHFPQQLSGGQQQRIAIARAVITNPELILADEPTGNLDSKNGLEVMKLLRELNHDHTTIVMATHNQRDAEFAHRKIQMFDGQLIVEHRS
jgi:putative ABC transport system ATP-binding protein